MKSHRISAIPLVVTLALCPGVAWAQEQQAPQAAGQAVEPPFEEIVVTAQKRAENIQDVPISIAAVSGGQLRSGGVNSISDLGQLVPSFTSSRSAQSSNVRLNVRGVGALSGTGIEPSVATFLDDVYVPRPGPLIGRFYDVQTIEVLRGPQGTLFGRNASVGALNVHTARPTQKFEGELSAEAASYDSYEATGMLNTPISDAAAFRLAGLVSTTNGSAKTRVGNHRIGAQDNYGVRASLLLEPLPGLTWLLRADYFKITGDGAANNEVKPDTVTPANRAAFAAALGAGNLPDLVDPYDQVNNNFVTGKVNDRQYGLTSNLSLEFGEGFTVRLLDAYRNWRNRQTDGDILFTPLNMAIRDGLYSSTSQSHELQLISPKDELLDGRFNFVAGLYYFKETFKTAEDITFSSNFCNIVAPRVSAALVAPCLAGVSRPSTLNNFSQTLNSYAAFTQADFKLTDTLTILLGGRYTRDKKRGRFVQTLGNDSGRIFRAAENSTLRFSDGQFTWRANLTYRPNDDMMVFANYSTGFKSGGFNAGGGTRVLNQARIFNSETVDNYELGVKSEFMGGGLIANATLYRMDIKGLQDRAFDGTSLTVGNAGSLRQQGVELDLVARPMRGLQFNAAVAYLDSSFLRYDRASNLPGLPGTQDLRGTRATFSPKWQGSLGGQYETDIGDSGYRLAFRGDMTFISDSNIGLITDNNPQSIQKAYQLVNARITLNSPDGTWSASVFGTNIFDKGYCNSIFAQTFDSVFGLRDGRGNTLMRCSVGEPRKIGGRVTFRF